MQSNIATQKDVKFDELRTEMKINQMKTFTLEKTTERIFRKIFDTPNMSESNEDLGERTQENSSIVPQKINSEKMNETESSFAIAFNLTSSRVDELEAELRLLQSKYHANSRKLAEVLNRPQLSFWNASSDKSHDENAMIIELRRSIEMLRFDRRCKLQNYKTFFNVPSLSYWYDWHNIFVSFQ